MCIIRFDRRITEAQASRARMKREKGKTSEKREIGTLMTKRIARLRARKRRGSVGGGYGERKESKVTVGCTTFVIYRVSQKVDFLNQRSLSNARKIYLEQRHRRRDRIMQFVDGSIDGLIVVAGVKN